MGHIRASPTTTPRLHPNVTLEGLERAQMRVRGSQTHTRVDKLHPQLRVLIASSPARAEWITSLQLRAWKGGANLD
jgi:hypothetical protein